MSEFFDGDPRAQAVAVEVVTAVDALGPHTVRTSRSQVAFRRAKGFAYLWRPGQYVRSEVPVVLSIALPHEVQHPRWKEVAHPAPRVWMHHLELHEPGDVDDDVRVWLGEAFDAAGRRFAARDGAAGSRHDRPMDVAAVAEHLASLEDVRESRVGSRRTWRTRGRLVARLEDDETLLVRSRRPARERLVASDPDAFYVTPALEAHEKVLVHLPAADADAVRRALTAAWEMQR